MKKIFLGLYIGFWLGCATLSVGKVPENTMEPYKWTLVPSVAGVMLIPAILGYEIAKDSKKGER